MKRKPIKKVLSSKQAANILIIGLLLSLVVIIGLIYRGNSSHKLGSQTVADISADNCASLDVRRQNVYSCYKAKLTDIINQQSPEKATDFVKAEYDSVPYVKSNCHQLMHVIGRAAYAKYNNLADTFAHGSQYCNGGYYHGLSEQLGNEKGSAYLYANANTICKPIADKKGRYSFYHYNCVHGLGHAFMEVYEGELYKSLAGCDTIQDEWERNSCYGGVFMQNIMIEQSPDDSEDHESKYLKPEDPMYPCDAVDDKYKVQCYTMQTSYALQVENYDFVKVFQLCDATPAPYNTNCYISLGRDASGKTVYEPARTEELCAMSITPEGQEYCIYGAMQDYIDNFQNDKLARQVCNLAPSDITAQCLSRDQAYAKRF